MDLGSSTFDTPGDTPPGRSTSALLEELEQIGELRRDAATAEVATIVDWVGENTVADMEAGTATLTDRGLDTGLPVAGPLPLDLTGRTTLDRRPHGTRRINPITADDPPEE